LKLYLEVISEVLHIGELSLGIPVELLFRIFNRKVINLIV